MQALAEHVKTTVYIKVLHNIYETSSAFISVNEPTADVTERCINKVIPSLQVDLVSVVLNMESSRNQN